MTGKKRTLHNKERGDEVETASKFSGSDTKREENADITEDDEDYCSINDQIFQACNFDYRSDQESEAAFSCPSETVSAPALKIQVVSTAELQQIMREMASTIVQAIEILLRNLSKDKSSHLLYNK